jgi:hypothetical protein
LTALVAFYTYTLIWNLLGEQGLLEKRAYPKMNYNTLKKKCELSWFGTKKVHIVIFVLGKSN